MGDDNLLYSLEKKHANDLVDECKQHIALTEEYYLDLEIINPRVIRLLCDYYASSTIVLEELNFSIDNELIRKEKNKEEIVFTEERMMLIESATVSRFHTVQLLQHHHVSMMYN